MMEKRQIIAYLIMKNKEKVSLQEFINYFKTQEKSKLNKDSGNLFNDLLKILYEKANDEYKLYFKALSNFPYSLVKDNIDLIEIICSNFKYLSLLSRVHEISQKQKSIIARNSLSFIDLKDEDHANHIDIIDKQINLILSGDSCLVDKSVDELNSFFNELDNELLKEFLARTIKRIKSDTLNDLYVRKSLESKLLADKSKIVFNSYLLDSIEYKKKRKNYKF